MTGGGPSRQPAGPRLDASYFEALYERHPDPWGFETSPYERAKYDRTLAALGGRRFRRGLEVGCSIGVLTARLATRCGLLVGVDVSRRALERARARLAGTPGVVLERRALPDELGEVTGTHGPFDLVVCSEVLYYWSEELLRASLPALGEAVEPGGCLLAVHWRGPTGYPTAGDRVHELLGEALSGWHRAVSRRDPRYLLDRYDRPEPAR